MRSSILSVLRPDGFKILLEILVRTPDLRVGEQPFTFGKRVAGTSKASVGELYRYWKLLLRLRAGTLIPRFGRFAMVGVTGLAVNTLALAFFTQVAGMHYLWGALQRRRCRRSGTSRSPNGGCSPGPTSARA